MTRLHPLAPAAMAVAALIALAGCGKISDPDKPEAGLPGARTTPLSPLTGPDIEAAGLEGELSCGFSRNDRVTLLVAKGVVASKTPAQAVVKAGAGIKKLTAPGGFDGMLEGAAFTGDGLSARVLVTGPATEGGESPPRPATLTYQGAEGPGEVVSGMWTCGP